MSTEAYSGADWGEKMSFTVGMSYVVGKIKFFDYWKIFFKNKWVINGFYGMK